MDVAFFHIAEIYTVVDYEDDIEWSSNSPRGRFVDGDKGGSSRLSRCLMSNTTPFPMPFASTGLSDSERSLSWLDSYPVAFICPTSGAKSRISESSPYIKDVDLGRSLHTQLSIQIEPSVLRIYKLLNWKYIRSLRWGIRKEVTVEKTERVQLLPPNHQLIILTRTIPGIELFSRSSFSESLNNRQRRGSVKKKWPHAPNSGFKKPTWQPRQHGADIDAVIDQRGT